MEKDFINALLSRVKETGIQPSLTVMVLLGVLAALWVGSGFLAAALAERRDKNRLVQFLLGLALPWIYPIILSKAPTVSETYRKNVEEAVPEEEKPASAPASSPAAAAVAVPDEEDATIPFAAKVMTNQQGARLLTFDQEAFKNAMYDDEGQRRGPFHVKLTDGTTFTAEHIIEALDNVVVLNVKGDAGELKKLRVPFVRIADCATFSPEADDAADPRHWDDSMKTTEMTVPRDALDTRIGETIPAKRL